MLFGEFWIQKEKKFKIPKEYSSKIEIVESKYTCPEIEQLIIIDKKLEKNFKSKDEKPSAVVKRELKMTKQYEEHYDYWSERGVDNLVSAIKKYSKKEKDKNLTLYSIIKN